MKKSLLIHPEELSCKWIDRMATLGVQVLALHPAGGKNAHKSLMEMLRLLETAEYRALLSPVSLVQITKRCTVNRISLRSANKPINIKSCCIATAAFLVG